MSGSRVHASAPVADVRTAAFADLHTGVLAGVLTGVLVGVLTGAAAPPAYAEDLRDHPCQLVTLDDATDNVVTEQVSRPLEVMGVDRAQALFERSGRVAGEGVVVAVIDSGVSPIAGINVVERIHIAGATPPEHYHGTAVAGLIAGQARPDSPDPLPVGVAPGAGILDVQVYDDPAADEDSDGVPIRAENVAAGLQAVIDALPRHNVKVVNISLAVPDSREVRQRVKTLWRRGVVVVAATGNRPREGDVSNPLTAEFHPHQPGENAAHAVHPASYPSVLGVNASMTGVDPGVSPTTYVLENSRSDIAAPTAGAVSYSVTGGTCLLVEPATSWAAAQVSGVLAMLQSAYDETPAKAVRRLLTTANGRADIPNKLLGAGEVEAYAALTQPLTMDDQGNFDPTAARGEQQRVPAPEPQPDLLASIRRDAVWWGLVGGGVLILALVLRPVLARRRSEGAS